MTSSAHSTDLAARWRDAFLTALQRPENSAPLKDAALGVSLGLDLTAWTSRLTTVVVESCLQLGWCAAAKGFPLDLLPQAGQEYLGIDVMAFEKAPSAEGRRWPFPAAVFELENSRDDDRVAYALWKVLCLRSPLRAVFAYRADWQQARGLISRLDADVVGSIPLNQRADLGGQTLVVAGSRGEGETFPWGYFKLWQLDLNLGRFEKL
jgi:hypothetical protein